MKAFVIRPNYTTEVVEVDGYKDIQEHVGGLITGVTGYHHGQELAVYANDEGLLLNLDFNTLATILCHQLIVGPIVVTGPTDDEGGDTPVPADLIELYTR